MPYLLSYFPCTFGRQLENILLDPFPVLGTAARVANVQKQIFENLTEMIVFGPSHTHNLHTFEIGINCTDVNAQDEDGFTLLMLAIIDPHPLYVKLLLAKKSLEVNLANNDGHSALAFLSAHTTFSDRMVHHFLERQAAFNDVDFSNVNDDVPLLLNAIQLNRLHYADILLDCSSYHPSPAELATARDILTQGSANKETLLYKIKIKEQLSYRGAEQATANVHWSS